MASSVQYALASGTVLSAYATAFITRSLTETWTNTRAQAGKAGKGSKEDTIWSAKYVFRKTDWRRAIDITNADTEKDVCPQVSLSNTDIGRASEKQYATNLGVVLLIKFCPRSHEVVHFYFDRHI